MIRASIDIGSNSCLLLVARVDKDENIHTLESFARVTSLGQNLDENKLFLQESMDSTFNALKEYKEVILKYDLDPKEVLVSATEASRVAKNADKFFSLIKNKLGFSTLKISGEGEAFYTALGVSTGVLSKSDVITIMDIGGASTELIKVGLNPFEILSSISLPVGSVRASDWLEADIFKSKFDDALVDNIEIYSTDNLICVAGTMTTLSAILLDQRRFIEEEIQGHSFEIDKLQALSSKLSNMNTSQINLEYPLCGKRASSIYAGSLVAIKIAKLLNIKKIEISTLGLRYGVLKEGKINERFIK